MANVSYGEAKKLVYKGMIVLGVVTLIEVAVSLFGKGYLGIDPEAFSMNVGGMEINIILILVGLAIIVLSIYKAYYIIYNFMHMAHEVKGLRMSVLLPTALLLWAVIAFFQEGNSWKQRREQIKEKNQLPAVDESKPQGYLITEEDLFRG